MPTKDLLYQYPVHAQEPPFYQAFNPDAGFPWPQPVELPRRKLQLVNEGLSLASFFTPLTPAFDPGDGFAWPQPATLTYRPKRHQQGLSVLGNEEYVPVQDKSLSWFNLRPDHVDRKKPLVNQGWYVKPAPGDQFLGDPYLAWYRQPSERIRTRRPNVAEGRSVLGNTETLPFDQIGWYRQPSERLRVRRPNTSTGYYILGNEETVPFEEKSLSWWRQPSERIRTRKPLVQTGWFAIGSEDAFDAALYPYRSPPMALYRPRTLNQPGLSVRGIPTEQLLGEPWLAWYRQPSERIRTRRPNVNTGLIRNPGLASEFVHLAWWKQPSERLRVRRPIVQTGYWALGNLETLPMTDRNLSWYRQPSERIRTRRPNVNTGYLVWVISFLADATALIGGVPRILIRRLDIDRIPSENEPDNIAKREVDRVSREIEHLRQEDIDRL